MNLQQTGKSAAAAAEKWLTNIRADKRRKRKIGKILWSICRALFLFGMGFVLLYPLLLALSISFREQQDMLNPAVVWIPRHFTLDNIKNVIEQMDYWNALKNTLSLTFISVILQVASCAFVGYGFARFNFRCKNLLFALVIFTIIVPPQVVYIPNYLMYKDFNFFGIGSLVGLFTGKDLTVNLLNTPYVLYLPALLGVGIRSGLFIYIFRQFYRNLPKELEDAAYIDGCGYYKTFFRIILPNARTSILTVLLFSVVWYWNDYFMTSMYTSINTVSTALSMLAESSVNLDAYIKPSLLQSGCLLVMLPLLILYLCCERFFTGGIERSGIVG